MTEGQLLSLAQQVISGLSAGSIYALLALALVLIYQSTDVVNFAQGEMAMFTTFIAFTLLTWYGVPFVPAVVLTLVFAFGLGYVVERVVIRPVEDAPVLSVVIVTLGLYSIFNSVAGWVWGYVPKGFPSPIPGGTVRFLGLTVGLLDLWILGCALAIMVLLHLFLRRTTLGTAMRATAHNRTAARLVGIPVGRMLSLGWGLSAMLGAIAGMLAAPKIFLEPNMMAGVLLYAFAGAVLGGLGSPFGAIAGGLLVGVIENLLGALVATELKAGLAFFMILAVLVVRPQGLFGTAHRRKV